MGSAGSVNKVGDSSAQLEEKYKTYGQAYSHDPQFKGPVPNRSCTDWICLIVYGIFSLGGMVIAIIAFSMGNPALLAYPSDSQGKLCGYNDMVSRPYLFFFDLLHCIRDLNKLPLTGCKTTQICVETCPDKVWSWLALSAEEARTGASASVRKAHLKCVDKIDFNKEQWLTTKISQLVQQGQCAPYTIPQRPVLKYCMPSFLVDSIEGNKNNEASLKNATIFDASGKEYTLSDLGASKEAFQAMMKVQEWGERVLADIRESWPHMLCFVGFTLIFAFVWIVLLRYIAAVIVWSTIVLFLLMWLFGAAFCFWRYNLIAHVVDIPTPPGELAKFTAAISFQTSFDSKELWMAIAVICVVMLLITIVLLCFLGSRIKLAVKLFEETSKAIGHMPSVLIWPFIPFSFEMATVGWVVAVAICLATISRAQFVSSQPNSTYQGLIPLPDSVKNCDFTYELTKISNFSENAVSKVESAFKVDFISANESSSLANKAVTAVNKTMADACRFLKNTVVEYAVYLQVYNAFMFFWHFHFLSGTGMITLAGTFGTYYWAFNKPQDIPLFPLFKGLWRTIRYHLGSAALGSLLIAIVSITKLVLEYIMFKLKASRNCVGVLLMKCLYCCFACLEKLVKFIARKAYIIVAIHGKNFCASAHEGWGLVMRNAVRAAVLTGVSRFLVVISILIVTGGIVVFAYFYFHGEISAGIGTKFLVDTWPTLNYFYVPLIIVAIAAFTIASIFFYVYDFGAETMFLCFLEDTERNNGTPEHPYYMSKNLASALR